MSVVNKIKWLFSNKHPYKLLIGYILRKSRLSEHFTIDKGYYKLKFYPSALLMHYWADPYCREDEILFLQRLVKYNSVVVDIGANVGTITLPLASFVGEKGKVFTIEAHPETYNVLKHNILFNNHLKNIVSFNYAVGNNSGEVKFSNISSDDMNKIINDNNKNFLVVPMHKLDDILEPYNIKRVRLLKIDIEGYELFALEGASEILSKTEIVFFETAESHFNYFGYSTKDIILFLLNLKFKIFRFDVNQLVEVDESYISLKPENLIAFEESFDIGTLYEEDE